MQPLRYSINVTLDGCVDHREGIADAELHHHAMESIARADVLILGRITYQLMEVWKLPGALTEMPEWTHPFARTIDAAKKLVVSSTLKSLDWNNAELAGSDFVNTIRELKRKPGKGLAVGGVTLPLALAELGLIDEYEFVVHPRIVGHGPTLFAGLSKVIDLKLVSRLEYASGAVALRYEAKRESA